jgi:hypothetical protein
MNLPLALLCFAVGFVRDALGTAWTLSVSRDRVLSAGGLASILTWLDLGVFAGVFIEKAWLAGAAYGLGCGLGCMAIMLIRRRR